MNPLIKQSLTAFAGLTLGVMPAYAAPNLASGDIAIAFYAVDGTVVDPNTYVLNLGPAHLYRENTLTDVPLTQINPGLASSNIGADLQATFGPDWAESGLVRWAVIGGVDQLSATISGDPARTGYISRARNTLATGVNGPGSTIANISSTNVAIFSTNISAFRVGTNDGIQGINDDTSQAGANANGVILPTSNKRSFEKFVPPTVLGTHFGIGPSPLQTFSSGPVAGGTTSEGALDIYRLLHTTNGADLTVGASTGNAAVGRGQFIGTITIDSSGNLRMTSIGAITVNPDSDNDGLPDEWEMTHFGNLNQSGTDDFDGDGTDNLTEYRLGLDPKSGSSRFAATITSGSSLQWPSAVGLTFVVQRSTTLLPDSWGNDVIVPGTAGTATYTDPNPPEGKAFYRVRLNP